jgi:hypothetical protein
MRRFIFIFVVLYSASFIFGYPARAQTSPLPFSPAQAEKHFQTGKAAYLREDLTTAINQFQSALQKWPTHKESWTWLTAAYQYVRQTDDYRHALFFRERTAWAMTLDLRHARQIFKDIATGRVKKTRRNPRYQTTAKSLTTFYNYIICRIESAHDRTLAQKLSANQESGLERIMRLARDPNWYPCRIGKIEAEQFNRVAK